MILFEELHSDEPDLRCLEELDEDWRPLPDDDTDVQDGPISDELDAESGQWRTRGPL